MTRYAIGLDFGTSSVRLLLLDLDRGTTRDRVFAYPSGDEGVVLSPSDPHLARQHPGDYLQGLEHLLRWAAEQTVDGEVIGIGVDTTGSSPLPLDAEGVPLAFHPQFSDNLAALVWLWKDHTSHAEAAEITELCKQLGRPYLTRCGGTYSSEWYWSKALRCARTAPDVFAATGAWAEIADWIPGELTGTTSPDLMARSRCAAGHKAMVADEWGGLPDAEFLAALSPQLAALRAKPYRAPQTSDHAAGRLCEKWAAKSGLPAGIPVAVGAFDAHMGAVGAGVRPGVLVKIMGTSTCDCMVHPREVPLPDIPGMCGIVDGSILPGMWGLEAGQSAVGDLFNWVTRLTHSTHDALTTEAARLRPGQSGLMVLDWNNGNRSILVDPLLSGLVVGQTLGTTAGELYRAAIEATAFGALTIIDQMESHGVQVQEVVACGGLAERNDLVMDIYANVLNRPIGVAASSQTCALGAAIFGAVVGGAFPRAEVAQSALVAPPSKTFHPRPADANRYRQLYRLYRDLHDTFGRPEPGSLHHVMKALLAMQGHND